MRHAVLLLCLLTGCNTIELNRIRVDDSYVEVSDVVKNSFTPEARTAIQGIKIYEGLHINSYAVGVNFWSNFISFLTFNGVGRKIISSQGTLCSGDLIATVVHEYVHHLDDMDRDGEIEIIDQEAFRKALQKMQEDPVTADAVASILEKSDRFVTNVFGVGPMSEEIAYTASWIVDNPNICPRYMHHIFARILSVSRRKVEQQPN
jgi:hypothetical protein